MSDPTPYDPDRFLRRFVVVTVISVSSIIALVVIISTILVPAMSNNAAPKVLENWGGLIIGFYFGTFVGLLKDWLSEPKQGPPSNPNAPVSGASGNTPPPPTKP